VIPTVSIPQGLNAILQFVPNGDFSTIANQMLEAIKEPLSGEITIANRDVEINGVEVSKGEVIALLEGKLVVSTKSLNDACMLLLESAKTEERERVTLFYGNDLTIEDVNPLAQMIQEKYPEHEIEVLEGKQPHYHYIIAIE